MYHVAFFLYIYIYGAYPRAYLVTCVSENLYIYIRRIPWRIPFFFTFFLPLGFRVRKRPGAYPLMHIPKFRRIPPAAYA